MERSVVAVVVSLGFEEVSAMVDADPEIRGTGVKEKLEARCQLS